MFCFVPLDITPIRQHCPRSDRLQTLLPSRGSRYRFVGIPLAVSAVSGIVPV